MRPSSLGGGRILRRTLSVCPSVPLSDEVFLFYSRTVLRANIQNRKISVFAYGPASRMYFSARTEGRISYGHLGRTNSCLANKVLQYFEVTSFFRLSNYRATLWPSVEFAVARRLPLRLHKCVVRLSAIQDKNQKQLPQAIGMSLLL